MALSRDGRRGLSYGVDRTLRLWDLDRRREIARPPDSLPSINCIALAPAGDVAYYGTDEGLVVRRDLADGSEPSPPIQAHEGPVNGIALDAAGRVILTGGADGKLRLWGREGMTELGTLSGHAGRVRSVALAEDGLTALSGGDDQTVRLWRLPRPGPAGGP